MATVLVGTVTEMGRGRDLIYLYWWRRRARDYVEGCRTRVARDSQLPAHSTQTSAFVGSFFLPPPSLWHISFFTSPSPYTQCTSLFTVMPTSMPIDHPHSSIRRKPKSTTNAWAYLLITLSPVALFLPATLQIGTPPPDSGCCWDQGICSLTHSPLH